MHKTKYSKVSTVAERIQAALTIKGMRQADICKLANISKSSMSQYMSGYYEPKQDRVCAMARALNVNEAWLRGYDVPMDMDAKTAGLAEPKLSECERMWLELYNREPEDTKDLLINMVASFSRAPKEQKKLAAMMICVALGDQ